MKKCWFVFFMVFLTACSTTTNGNSLMLSEIYNTGMPQGFEQINVKNIVQKHIPISTQKSEVLSTLKKLGCKDIIEESDNTVFARYTWGKPMLDPDARSVAMTFSFGSDNRLVSIEAFYLKAQ